MKKEYKITDATRKELIDFLSEYTFANIKFNAPIADLHLQLLTLAISVGKK